MNILATSVGRRTQLLKYFKEQLKEEGKLIATDNSPLAPAAYIADEFYLVPKINEPEYLDRLLDICKKEDIKAVFSLIDPELSIIAKNAHKFEEIGVRPIVSEYDACEIWLDKFEAQSFCIERGFNYAKTYCDFKKFENALEKGEIDFPVFIKPQKGSASLHISKVNNIEQARLIWDSVPDLIVQEFLDGQELGVDVYIDFLTEEIVAIFIKEKIAMRAGETDKSRSVKSEELFGIIKSLVKQANLKGPIDIDVFDVDGKYYISEINPRFGGGYLHAYECGVNFPKYIMNNLKGIANKPEIGNYQDDIYMMKHDTVTIKSKAELG